MSRRQDIEPMKQGIFTLTRENEPRLKFEGVLVTSASGELPNVEEQMRWTELSLYRTKGGKFVVQRVKVSSYEGERNRYETWILSNLSTVTQLLGFGPLSQELYSRVNATLGEDAINYSETLE